MADAKPIIIIKKKGGHGGHHGGAWKVAYADFVTAMMALFIVLWLLNSSKQVQEAVGGYFKDPTGTSKKIGSSMQGSGESFELTKDDMPKLKDELQKSVRKLAAFDKLKDHIEMTVTAEGLRIELMESEAGTFFESGNPVPTPTGREFLSAMAHELGKLPNKISIEGHTDARPFAGVGNYGNWELSADRANAARRLMQENGITGDQVMQIRGYADQQLRKKDDPNDPSNRRITIIVQYTPKSDEEAKGAEEKTGEAKSGGESPKADTSEPPKGSEAPKNGEEKITAEH
jgi:chemotaxis protein MotB